MAETMANISLQQLLTRVIKQARKAIMRGPIESGSWLRGLLSAVGDFQKLDL